MHGKKIGMNRNAARMNRKDPSAAGPQPKFEIAGLVSLRSLQRNSKFEGCEFAVEEIFARMIDFVDLQCMGRKEIWRSLHSISFGISATNCATLASASPYGVGTAETRARTHRKPILSFITPGEE